MTGRKAALPADAEVLVYNTVNPVIFNGGQTVKTLSAAFLADLEGHWRTHKTRILDVLADKYPQAYFAGLVALSKVIRWEVGEAGAFDRGLTPDEIMAKLEQRVGPEGKRLFEKFMRDVNRLQMKQIAMQQAAEEDQGEGGNE